MVAVRVVVAQQVFLPMPCSLSAITFFFLCVFSFIFSYNFFVMVGYYLLDVAYTAVSDFDCVSV